MKIINGDSAEFGAWMRDLLLRRSTEEGAARSVATAIIEAVGRHGDDEVARVLHQFDGVDIAADTILETVGQETSGSVSNELRAALDLAIERVTEFHRRQAVTGYAFDENGSLFEHLVRPLRRVGIYVPGGRAVYLSTLIMCAVPARIAGVRELVVATTPRAAADPAFKYLCRALQVSEVYRCGGPAGVAALALGTATLRRVDKIVGPGNSYVTAAKQLLVGTVGIDMTAGPTEIVLVADDGSDPELVAIDLLAQAEHGDDSTVICVTDSVAFATALRERVQERLAQSPGSAACRSIPANGVVVMVGDITRAVEIINEIGPEHVSIQVDPARLDLDAIEDCGAIFIGRYAPVAIGDYIAGPNHVLPTAGAGRFFSPLGVYDFVKRSNRITLSSETFDAIAEQGALLATSEGLPLHAQSIAVRSKEEVTR